MIDAYSDIEIVGILIARGIVAHGVAVSVLALYFVPVLLDIEVDYYKTGNLKFFSMGGYKYSNCSGKRILCSLAKTWYDPEAGRIICDDKDLAADLEAAIANI